MPAPGGDSGKEIRERLRFANKGAFKIQLVIGPLLSQKDYADIKRTLPRGIHAVKADIPVQPLYSLNRDAVPDAHGPDYSVYISTSRHPYMLVWPEDLNQEWQRVLGLVMSIFQEYESSEHPSGGAAPLPAAGKR
jgi:hypothetical protein